MPIPNWKIFSYLSDLTCPDRRGYWFKIITDDLPIVGFDFSVLAAWVWYPELILAVGQGTGVVAGLLGIYLTGLRIKHVRKQIKQLDSAESDV